MWSKRQYCIKIFELSQTRVEGKNESRLHICLRFLLPKSYRNKTINKYFVFHIRPWFATNTKQRYLYSCQTRRATSFQSCPPGDTCSTCMSIPTPYLRGVLFIFADYIWSYVLRIRAYMSRRKVPNHRPVWELHTSATPPPLLLVSIESTTNLVGHSIFTSIRDRNKNVNF